MAVGSVRYGQLNRSFVYSYTPQGNISAVCDGDRQSTYQYDEINQLIRENNAYLNQTVTYSYDAADKIERDFGRNEGTLGEDRKTTRPSAGNARKSEIWAETAENTPPRNGVHI